MSNLFKKVTSTVGAIAIAVSSVSSTLTVSAASNFAPYADALATAGIISKQTTEAGYNLGNNVTRAEMAKVAVNIKKATVKECTGKVFSDVTSKLGDLCGYVEAAAEAGLVNKTASKFRPMDLVTRAEMLKMLLSAQGIAPTTEDQGFKDLGSDASLNGYINAAAKAGIINKGTSFNPNNNASRGEAFKVASNSVGLTTSAVETTTGDDLNLGDLFGDTTSTGTTATTVSTGTTTATSTVAAGDLEVALNPASPAATSVPMVASAVPYLTVDFTAGSSDISINSVKLKREGFGTRDDLSRVWFERNGVRVSERASFVSDDTSTVIFSPALVVKAGSTETLRIVAQQNSGANVVNRVSILSADLVSSTAAKVSGNFPIVGASMTAANYTVANLDVTYQGSDTNYQIGNKNVEFARVRLLNASSTKDVKVNSVKFRNNLNGELTYLENIGLYEGGVQVGSGIISGSRDIVFTLNDYVLKAGVSKTFTIQANPTNVRNAAGDQYQFVVRYQEDLNAVEVATGFGAPNNVVTPNGTTPTYTVKGSTITISRSSTSPSTQTISAGTNDVTLLVADAKINQGFRVDGLNLKLDITGLGGSDLRTSSFSNIRVYIGDRLYNSFDFASTGADSTGTGTFYKAFDSSWTFDAGNTTFKVVANVRSSAVIGSSIKASLGDVTGSVFKNPRYTQSDNTVASTEISASANGLAAQVGSNNVTIVRNDGYSTGSQNVVAGALNYPVFKATMNAGNVSDVKVTKLSFNVSSDTGSLNLLTNWRVLVDGVQNGSARTINSGTVGFTDLNFVIAKNKTVTVSVIADIGTGFIPTGATSATIVMDMSTTNSTIQNVTSGQTLSSSELGYTTTSAGLSVQSAGSLTIARDGNTPTSTVLVANTQNVELARFRFSTKYDDMYVRHLYVANVASGSVDSSADARVNQLKLYDATGNILATASLQNGVAHFSLGDSTLKLAANTSTVLTVKADFNPIISAAQTGKMIQLALNGAADDGVTGIVAGTVNGANIVSVSTGIPLAQINGTGAVDNSAYATTDKHQIRKTALTVATVPLSNSTFAAATGKEIYRFTVTADSAGDAYLKQVTAKITTTNATVSTGSVKLYKSTDESNAIATAVGSGVADGSTTKIALTLGTEQVIAAGQSVTYIVKADLTSTATSGAKSSLSTSLVEEQGTAFAAAGTNSVAGDFIFGDNSDNSSTRGGSLAEYFTGYKTRSFPTAASSLIQ